jgi:hypothetical protein
MSHFSWQGVMTIPTTRLGTLGRVRTWIAAAAALVTLALTAFAPSAAQAATIAGESNAGAAGTRARRHDTDAGHEV